MSIKTKIFTFAITIALLILGLGYYYFYGMTTKQTNTNINKIELTDNLFTYNVYSDFYFRVAKYSNGEKVSEYSELQPLKIDIGFNLKDKVAKPIIKTDDNGKKLILIEKNSNEINKEVDIMSEFKYIFGDIVVTQESNDYINLSVKHLNKILKNLFGKTVTIEKKSYYTKIDNLPIKNLKITHYKLSEIPKNLRGDIVIADMNSIKTGKESIVEWNFGEEDSIQLKYVTKWKNSKLEDYLKEVYPNKTIINLISVNNGNTNKMYIIEDREKNKLYALFMDSNGYVYSLIYKAQNPESFKKYLKDYLKIAYGIYFIDTKDFKNPFAKKQENLREISGLYISFGVKVGSMYDYYKTNNLDISQEDIESYKKMAGLDKGKLGFNCISEDEIDLRINNYPYEHEVNQLDCIATENFEYIIIWNKSKQVFKAGEEYIINVREVDIASDDVYPQTTIKLTYDDIKRINSGEYVKKSIGSNYFVGFSKDLK